MNDKTCRKPLNIALGTAFAASMTVAGAASAATTANPFQVQEISSPSGYTQLAGGEGHCGGKKGGEGHCGGKKDGEGSCGEGSCGSAKS